MSELEFTEFGSEGVIVNETGLDDEEVFQAIAEQHPELAMLGRWSRDIRSRNQGLLSRDHYVSPRGIFKEFQVAQDAAETDDVVSNVLETTEQLAFNRVQIECSDADQTDVWNQLLDEIDIENVFRQVWRELFVVSNCYVAVLYGKRSYRVGGKSETGTRRKKVFSDLEVPLGVAVLDPLKVVPVGSFLFGKERLVYLAEGEEVAEIEKTLADKNSSNLDKDLVAASLVEKAYNFSQAEIKSLEQLTGESLRSFKPYLLKQDRVFRLTSTRPDYQKFATCRMRSVFELLDMKSQLRQQDRAFLLGATSFILLVKKGSDQHPAQRGETTALGHQLKMNPKVPMVISDHRTEIEIITPKLDKSLSPERYNSLDSRITARLYQLLLTGNYSAGTATDDSLKLTRVIARSMEARRNRMRAEFMRNVFLPVFENNSKFTEVPKLKFYPQRISLDFDPNVLAFLQDAREREDLSRTTMLAELDIDQVEEAEKRKVEQELYDKFFKQKGDPQQVGPPDEFEDEDEGAPTTRRGDGRRLGGRRNGGGLNRRSNMSNPSPGPGPGDGSEG